MATALPAAASRILADQDAPAATARTPSRQPSLLRRLFDAIAESQMRRAHREIVLGPGRFEALRGPLPPQR
jgi:hypothetical protein